MCSYGPEVTYSFGREITQKKLSPGPYEYICTYMYVLSWSVFHNSILDQKLTAKSVNLPKGILIICIRITDCSFIFMRIKQPFGSSQIPKNLERFSCDILETNNLLHLFENTFISQGMAQVM